mmetsp:Transcript_92515/g.239542  ORF Transcript_92515/g.239542 Transcript_92515/m.239542 type:complete len:2286 (-) Transcript_92515:182-7039(-)
MPSGCRKMQSAAALVAGAAAAEAFSLAPATAPVLRGTAPSAGPAANGAAPPQAAGDDSSTPATATPSSVPTTAAAAGGAAALAVLGAASSARAARRERRLRAKTTRAAVTMLEKDATAMTTPGEALKKLEQYVKERGGSRVLKRILIANNGMAATKAILSMRQWAYLELGLDQVFEFVVMATRDDLDANAEFIRLADTFVEVPSGKNVNNYANVDLICETAKAQKVDAVWPGWGHASENPDLPKKLKELGVTFIGPPSPVMSVLGDKIAANILAQTAGVPSIPWSGDGLTANLTEEGTIPEETFKKGCVTTAAEAVECAERIGFPVMVKASEGGGGKGIRMCGSKEEIEANFPQVQNEAPPGSPIFVMQLCQGARHIEVQIIGDEHGSAVALNGRDCSTQRRFQKIFEEGPPVVVPRDKFREMERAAQRLTKNIGYVGAGTVEYLYNVETNRFYFLELNPRLQVEHPVTEAITQVNLPATQVQVAMGIPLSQMPQIRKFYGKAPSDQQSPIDFMQDDYVYPTVHCMAARITAENPDDGFKPTSGKIDRIKFQSSVACWGYFSVWTHAGIHEFADSQFGHLFARGADREETRKTLMLALKNLDIVGEIRNPVEYLVELLATEAFVRNHIDTSWLDGIIKAKSVKPHYKHTDVVFYAAVFRVVQAARARDQELADAVSKRRLGLIGQAAGMNGFEVEIAFEGMRYNFRALRTGDNSYALDVGDDRILAQIRVQPDCSLLVTIGNFVTKVFGTEDALGLRLRLQGIGTIVLPTIYDPTELRSEFNGKIIRYLQPDGSTVKSGDAYVELEAMKMIMPLKAGATGRISHAKGVGSIVQAGELLASLELEDPSSAQTLSTFHGHFELAAAAAMAREQTPKASGALSDPLANALSIMDGFAPIRSPEAVAREALSASASEADDEQCIDIDTLSVIGNSLSSTEVGDSSRSEGKVRAIVAAGTLLERYLDVERKFAAHALPGQSEDIAYAALVEEGKDDPKGVVALLRARSQMEARNKMVLAALEVINSMQGDADKQLLGLAGRIQALAELPAAGGHGEVLTMARRLSKQLGLQSCSERRAALKGAIRTQPLEAMGKLSTWDSSKAGCDLLVGLLQDDIELVRSKALELFIRRTYRAFGVSHDSKVLVTDVGRGKMSARWRFRHPGVSMEEGSTQAWNGQCIVVSDLVALTKFIRNASFPSSQDTKASPRECGNRCRLHAILGSASPFEMMTEQVQAMLNSAQAALRVAGICEFVVVMPAAPSSASALHYATFATAREGSSWGEVQMRRDMSPTVFSLLEVSCLAKEYELEQIGHNAEWSSHVFLGTQRSEPGTASSAHPQTVFARLVSHSRINFEEPGGRWSDQLEAMLLGIAHDLESAALGRVPASATSARVVDSRLFLHLTSLVDSEPSALNSMLEGFMQHFVSRHGARLQKSWVDEIVIKVRLGRDTCQATLRFAASSRNGEYMKSVGLLEKVHPACGTPATRMPVGSSEEVVAGTTAADDKLRAKRMAARRAGSTYAPEFLGMLEAALVSQWAAHCRQIGGSVPKELLKSIELVMEPNGELKEIERAPGLNDIGMIAWRLMLKTPEYPDGRSIILVANDVTHKAGSFGVAEDSFFMKATRYARDHGLPRIHLSCNSGARVGLVEELMPKLRIKWNDASDPARGFEYLYLSEDDFKQLPSGAALARRVDGTSDGLGPHFALEAIVGEGLASTVGGIGVENLQGSGLIAGETSRAYSEIFTLSFITGRSVGIGAYLNRLGQRTIQAVDGPMILTGYSALNKLLGRDVYNSQDQLGGAQVMVPNGVTHELVRSDQEGAQAIIDWLSYVPRDTWSLPPMIRSVDPPNRRIGFKPTREPYDPRDMLAGVQTPDGFTPGFFDVGSFKEYLSGWGRTVVVGRARLGGMAMGVIAVETRNVERRVPADPGNPESREIVEAQAGQVWFPDSAHKTAAAIRDFNRGENLPLMIFANWRGFSGGTRDMHGEVLKFGAQIVDALVDYKHPVFIYIPPFGELRGGSWVVIDPAINPSVMEMYADVESRGGILEPAGIVEVKFREHQRREMMHRLDEKLVVLGKELQGASASSRSVDEIKAEITAREAQLLPLYTQVACEFADLHDRTGRMKATGCIREGLEWASAREFFYWRVRCRVLEQQLMKEVMTADSTMAAADAKSMVARWLPRAGDREVVEFLERADTVQQKVRSVRQAAIRRQIADLQEELGEMVEKTPRKHWLPRLLRRTRTGSSAATPKTPKTPASIAGASPVPTVSPSAAYPGLLGSERAAAAGAKGSKQRE